MFKVNLEILWFHSSISLSRLFWGDKDLKLFLFRLSLKQKEQKDAFERVTQDGRPYTREIWLRELFSKQFSFMHRSNEFYYVPESVAKTNLSDKFIVGWIARDKPILERTAPWNGLSPTEHESWQAALLLIDPTHHEDGQKVAMESHSDVGNADAILTSLSGYVFDLGPEEPYALSIFPIIRERSFEKFVKNNQNRIKEITYDAAVPNMWTDPNEFTNELKELRSKNVHRVKTTMKSDGAIDTENSQLDEIATYVESGGGKISAKTLDGEKYISDDHAMNEDIDINDVEPESPSYWERIKDALDRIF